jgi:hypothetical protein
MFSTNAPLFVAFGLSALDRIAYWRRIRLHGRAHSANGRSYQGTSFRDDVGGGKPEEHAGVPIKHKLLSSSHSTFDMDSSGFHD